MGLKSGVRKIGAEPLVDHANGDFLVQVADLFGLMAD